MLIKYVKQACVKIEQYKSLYIQTYYFNHIYLADFLIIIYHTYVCTRFIWRYTISSVACIIYLHVYFATTCLCYKFVIEYISITWFTYTAYTWGVSLRTHLNFLDYLSCIIATQVQKRWSIVWRYHLWRYAYLCLSNMIISL